MQSNNNNTNTNTNKKMNNTSKQVYTTFCKVCQDSGKTEKEYTSHNVRDAKGTCCPTLLAQECRNCYKKGHTSKYCPMQSQQNVVPKKETPKPVKQEKVNHVSKNVFMCLDDGDSSDEEAEAVQKVKTEPSPVLKAELKVAQKQALNYGKIIALAPEIVKKEEIAAIIKENNRVSKPAKIVVAHAPMRAPFSWANCETDSDGSDEEEEEDDSAW